MDLDFAPSARVIADSISPAGDRLTTIEVSLHRFVIAELLTHRKFSRNSASSRAIPVKKILDRVYKNPAIPLVWTSARQGMQGGAPLSTEDAAAARDIWLSARNAAADHAERLLLLGVHKSIVNRLLEPFLATTVIVSSTEWENFWIQRCSSLAQPEMEAAANVMRAAYDQSTAIPLNYGEWHLPYLSEDDKAAIPSISHTMVSAARCARVSYLTQDGKRDPAEDVRLYQRLMEAQPPHFSPLEHVATPRWPGVGEQLGNFVGWKQLRHISLPWRGEA